MFPCSRKLSRAEVRSELSNQILHLFIEPDEPNVEREQRGTGSKKSRERWLQDGRHGCWRVVVLAYCTARVSACSRVLVSLFSPDGGPRRTGNRVDMGAAQHSAAQHSTTHNTA